MNAYSELASAYTHTEQINRKDIETTFTLVIAGMLMPPTMIFRPEYVKEKVERVKKAIRDFAEKDPDLAIKKCNLLNNLIPSACDKIRIGDTEIPKCEFNPSGEILLGFKSFLWERLSELGSIPELDTTKSTIEEAFNIRLLDLNMNQILFSSGDIIN